MKRVATGRAPSEIAARWHLRLLGGFELSDGNLVLHRLPSRAAMLILARLALAPQRDHPREELIDLLWPEAGREVGRNRLRQALSTLRAVLEPAGALAPSTPMLVADRQVLRLAPGALSSDVEALRQAMLEQHAPRVAALYRGELLPGHFDEWVVDERRLLDAAVTRLQHDAAGSELPAVVLGRAAPPRVAVGKTWTPSRHWLPSYLTRMLGYEEIGATLGAAVHGHRLVLLRGPGGAGKTRLAVEVARACAEVGTRVPWPGADEVQPFDAVVFVPLAGITSAAGMAEAVLRALRSEGAGGGDAAARVELTLAGRRMLLVLDNFEQLVEAARETLLHWLAQLPELHLLVTSRRALAVDGEHEVALAALALPAIDASLQEHARNPAVALFVDRARAARASFSLTPANHRRVARIVLLLQGLPLAIELAAARVRSIGLPEMQRMLEAGAEGQPDAAFALLARSGPRAADDPRHASMQKVMAWSFEQLGAEARGLLDVLAVCAGGATLQAAATMTGQSAHALAAQVDDLVASSVVYTSQHVHEGGDEHTRYHPFEPVREYALMQLGAAALAALRERHWQWLWSWTAALGAAPSLPTFRDEQPNLLLAWRHAAQNGQAAQVLASALFCASALDDEILSPSGLALLRSCLDPAGADAELVARAHALLAVQCFESGQRDLASVHAETALRQMPRSSPFRVDALRAVVRIRLRVHNDIESIGALIEEGLALARQWQRVDMQARLLSTEGVLLARRHRDYLGKIERDTRALALWRELGAPQRVTEGLVNLALALGFVHRVREQLELLEQARDMAAALGQLRLHAFACSVSGYALADLKRWDESAASYRVCLNLAWTHSAWREWFYALWNLPRTLAHQRRPEQAARLMGFADRFASERFGQLGWSDLRERRRTRRLVRAQLGAAQEAALWAVGRELSMADAMRLANDLG